VCEWALANNKDPKALSGYWVDGSERIFETQEQAEAGGHEYIFEVDEEMVEATRVYFRYVRDIVDTAEMMGEKPALFVEQGFDLSFIHPGMFGTNDSSVFVPGRELTVIDYKHGSGKVVEVEDNPQLLYYALGALRELCWERNEGGWNERLMPETVRIVIVQPRAAHPNGPVREWVVTADYIIHEFAEALREAAIATTRHNAERKAGEWCHFCPAKVICPEFEDSVVRPVMDAFDFEDLEVPMAMPAKERDALGKAAGRKLAKDTPERIAQILALSNMLDALIEAAKAQAVQMARAGQEVPGYKLVYGTKHRKWIDPDKVVDALGLAIPQEAIFERRMKSPSQLENEGYGPFIDGLWEKPKGALTIAPLTDKREAVQVFDDRDLIA
jgi:hypothetical protein